MRRGIRFIAAVLAGVMFVVGMGMTSHAAGDVKYLEVTKEMEDGTEKTPEQIKEETLAASRALPIETNELKDWPQGPAICGEAGVVMDMDNGAILYAKSMDKKYYPASITKIMTALLALENSALTDTVTFTDESINCLRPGYAHIALRPGEQISMKDALHALMLASANEVAYAIGETVGGTHENFVKMMNDRAKELGCENTNFVNTNGIFDENHYVSAKDMALIAKEAFSHQELLDVMQTLQYTIQPTNLVNEARTFQQKHKMMVRGEHFDSRCIGGKTGYTEDSYNTLVTAMEENGKRIVIVIMGSRDDTVENTKSLADYAFQNFERVSIVENEKSETIRGISSEASVTIPKDLSFDDLKCEAESNGEVRYFYKDNLVGMTVATVSSEHKIESLEEKEKPKADDEKEDTSLKKIIIIVVIAAAVILLLLLIVIQIILIKKKKERERRRREMRRRRRQIEARRRRKQNADLWRD